MVLKPSSHLEKVTNNKQSFVIKTFIYLIDPQLEKFLFFLFFVSLLGFLPNVQDDFMCLQTDVSITKTVFKL